MFVSTDDVFGNGNDVQLGSLLHNGLLDVGQGYAVNNRLIYLPLSLASGDYFLFLDADASNNVFEDLAENNNTSAGLPITLVRDTADLQVTDVTSPAGAQSGDLITVSWTVQNLGTADTSANFWFDDVYLSADTTIDGGDRLLGRVQRTNPLAATDQYSVTRDFALPLDVAGNFLTIVRTDGTNVVFEPSLGNQQRLCLTDCPDDHHQPEPQSDPRPHAHRGLILRLMSTWSSPRSMHLPQP